MGEPTSFSQNAFGPQDGEQSAWTAENSEHQASIFNGLKLNRDQRFQLLAQHKEALIIIVKRTKMFRYQAHSLPRRRSFGSSRNPSQERMTNHKERTAWKATVHVVKKVL